MGNMVEEDVDVPSIVEELLPPSHDRYVVLRQFLDTVALRASPLAVAIWSTLISVALVAAWQIDARLDANRDMERLDFNTAVAPPFFLMVEGKPVDAFMDSLAPAREAVDQMANARLPVH